MPGEYGTFWFIIWKFLQFGAQISIVALFKHVDFFQITRFLNITFVRKLFDILLSEHSKCRMENSLVICEKRAESAFCQLSFSSENFC